MQQIALLLVVLFVCSTLGEAFYVTGGFYVPVTYDRYPGGDGAMKSQAKRKDSLPTGAGYGANDARRLMIEMPMPKRDFSLRRQQLKRMKPCFYSPIQCLMKRAS